MTDHGLYLPQPPEFPPSLRTLAIVSPKVELADVVAVPPPSEEKLSWTRPIPLLEVRYLAADH